MVSGIKTLGSFVNKDGQSVLLAGSKNLYHQTTVRHANATICSDDSLFVNVDHMSVAQRDNNLLIWFKKVLTSLGIRGDRTLPNIVGRANPPVSLTSKGHQVQFSPIIDRDLPHQRLLLVDANGTFQFLDQSLEKPGARWKETPFFVPSLDKYLEVPSYTCPAKLSDDQGAPCVD